MYNKIVILVKELFMKTIIVPPQFATQEEKSIVMISVLISILLPFTAVGALALFLPTVIAYFVFADKLGPNAKEILRLYSNFTLSAFIIGLVISPTILLLGLGVILELILGIYVFIYELIIIMAILNNTPVKIPVIFDLIKPSASIPYVNDNQNNNDENL